MKKVFSIVVCLMVLLAAAAVAYSCYGECWEYISGCISPFNCTKRDNYWYVATRNYPHKVCKGSTYPADEDKECTMAGSAICADTDVHDDSPCTPANKVGTATVNEPFATPASDACGWPV